MKNKWTLLVFGLLFLLFSGCAPQDLNTGELDYEKTKKMIVDILKTDDGKKAIQEIFTDEKMQQQLIMDQAVVQESIEKTLTSDKGAEFWKKTFEDPAFAETFAKSMRKEHEKLMKSLMQDPQYQGLLLDVLNNPEVDKQMIGILKSKEYRQHLQKAISDTFESPLFKAKIQDILIKAAEEMQGTKKQGDEGSQGQQSGGGSNQEGAS